MFKFKHLLNMSHSYVFGNIDRVDNNIPHGRRILIYKNGDIMAILKIIKKAK